MSKDQEKWINKVAKVWPVAKGSIREVKRPVRVKNAKRVRPGKNILLGCLRIMSTANKVANMSPKTRLILLNRLWIMVVN